MPLASSGLLSSSISRQAFRAVHNPGIPSSSARTLHTSSFVPRGIPQHLSSSSSSTSPFTSRIFHRTRTLFNAFVGHLTTPGTLRASNGAVPARSMQTHVVSRMPSIENNLSLPVRHALSVRMGSPHLPRPPVVPRSIAQVGLGTARNFTTGRPIFQNIADKIHNVPVVGRAFMEADLDSKARTKKDAALALRLRRSRNNSMSKKKRSSDNKLCFHTAAAAPARATATEVATEDKAREEFDKYFAPAQAPSVTTTLLVPLAPTPTARVPLSSHGYFTYDRHPLGPFLELSALHVDAEQHAARVRALFERLDAAHVWDSGGATSTTCEAFGGARGAGVLRVRFEGWSAHAVRGILGEAATGWCVLEEERADDEDSDGEMSDVTADCSGIAELNLSSSIDPAYSFVLPALDFSAASSIELPSDGPGIADTPPFSELVASSVSQTDFDAFSDVSYESDGESRSSGSPDLHAWIEPPDALGSRTPSWAGLSFSSAFSQRLEEGPREEMF